MPDPLATRWTQHYDVIQYHTLCNADPHNKFERQASEPREYRVGSKFPDERAGLNPLGPPVPSQAKAKTNYIAVWVHYQQNCFQSQRHAEMFRLIPHDSTRK
jgi:hypothetical protein